MTIYNSEGVAIYEAPITKSAVIKRELMGDYYIELSFDAVDPIGVGRGSYILHDGSKFEIMDNSLPEDTNTGGLRYTLRFEAQQSQMKRCKVFWRESDNLEVSFSDTTSISQFGNLIVKNINAFLGGNNWSLGSCPEDNTLKTISFGGDTCWDAVNTIAETFGVEWWTEENSGKVSLCFGKLELGTEVEFKKGDAVSSIPYRKGDSANYGTRFYVFGSTRNLPEDYASTESGGVTNHVVEKRLHLPNGRQYIDAKPNLKAEDIVEQVVFFDDIYPTNVDTITSVSYNSDGKVQLVYTVRCENTPFIPSNIIDGEQIQATFTSGSLNGRTFDIEIDRNNFDKNFKIVPEVLDEENGLFIPNASLKPNVGDTFILTGIVLPDGRVKEAEQLLLEAGTEYAQKNSNDTEVYNCPTNAIYCHANDCNYNLGQRVKLIGEKFGSGRSSRIQGYEKLLYDEYQAVYTVGDNSAYSRLGSVEKAVQKSEYSNRVGLEANIIRSKSDNTTPSDYNIYSALATEDLFLSKRKGGIVKGMTDFAAGLKVGGKAIRYDAEKKAWFFDGDFVVTGAITMFGSSAGFVPSTIMDGVQVDNDTIIINAAGQLQVIGGGGSGGTGGGLTAAEVNALISNALKPYALSSSIPTDNKQLENGAGYITAAALSGLATEQYVTTRGYITSDALAGYATESWVEGKKYLTGITSSQVTTALGYTPYNSSNPDKYIKGIDYDMVIAALGYTPYSTTNPMGYLTISSLLGYATEQWVGDNYLASSNFTKANIKSTLGISDWALAATKPSYTAAEVGALSKYGDTVYGLLTIDRDPSLIKFTKQSALLGYLGFSAKDNPIFWSAENNVISNLLHSNNIGFYNAGSATKLQTPRTIWGQSFDGSKDISGLLTDVAGIRGSTTDGGYIGDRNKGIGATDGGSMIYNYSASPITFHINGSERMRITDGGNIAIGDTTADARLHVRYDSGTTGIELHRQGEECSIGFSSTVNNTRFVAGIWGNCFNIWSENKGTIMAIADNGATINGNLLTTGTITMFSQLSMKNVIDYDGLSLAQLAQIKPTRFTWKDGRDTLVHAGGIADDVMQVLPEVIYQTSDDKLTMDYGSAAFYVGASLIKPVIDHEKRIAELERENKRKDEVIVILQNKLNQLSA